jgi:hypothetical protein
LSVDERGVIAEELQPAGLECGKELAAYSKNSAGRRGRGAMKVWRGRMRRQIERAFMAMPGRDLDTGTLCRWVWVRRHRFRTGQYERLRRIVREIADPVVRGPGRGRPWLWLLRDNA